MTSVDVQQVKRLEHELIEAFLNSDVRALDRILADGFTFTDPHGPPLTKQQWLRDLTSGQLKFDAIDIDDIQVTVHGDTALAHGRVKMKARSAQGGYNGLYHYTDVYVKEQGRWRAILSTAQYGNALTQN